MKKCILFIIIFISLSVYCFINKSKEELIYVNVNDEYKNTIYLTFDDGPSNTVTSLLLDLLKEYNIKVTFFVINKSSNLDYLISRAHNEGHTIGVHSYSHDYHYIYESESNFFYDINMMTSKVKSLTDYSSKIIRFPGGSSNTVSKFNPYIMTRLVNDINDKQIKYFDWNIDSKDTTNIDSETIYYNVINNLDKNKMNVVLMHDYENNEKIINSVRMIIEYGIKNGYKFDKLTINSPQVIHKIKN